MGAEDGFSGLLETNQGHATTIGNEDCFDPELTMTELLELDGEGRTIMTDHSLFVLFNVMCSPFVQSTQQKAYNECVIGVLSECSGRGALGF